MKQRLIDILTGEEMVPGFRCSFVDGMLVVRPAGKG
jgi:hypothetical protein